MSEAITFECTSSGQRLFREFVANHRLTNVQVAAALEVDKSTMTLWLRRGVAPESRHRRAIEKFTEGHVPADSWATAAEEAFVERVLPFREVVKQSGSKLAA